MDTAQKRAETQADLGPVIPHPRNGEAAVRRNGNADATVGSHGLESDAFIRRDLELPRYGLGLSECADCRQKPGEDQIESRIHDNLSGGSGSNHTVLLSTCYKRKPAVGLQGICKNFCRDCNDREVVAANVSPHEAMPHQSA